MAGGFPYFEYIVPFSPCRVSAENSDDNLMGFPLWVIALAALRILSLSLTLDSFNITCLGEGVFASC